MEIVGYEVDETGSHEDLDSLVVHRTEYVCEFCQTSYKDKEKACDCEENHKTIESIKEAKYISKKSDNSGKPSRILVGFNDGTTEWYKR